MSGMDKKGGKREIFSGFPWDFPKKSIDFF
jgi:hypothetical protein